MKRISDEEIKRAAYERNKLFGENDVFAYTRKSDADECIAKAQVKKAYEWRNEECTEHDHTINISGFNHKVIVMHNDCEECWQALLEEINEKETTVGD